MQKVTFPKVNGKYAFTPLFTPQHMLGKHEKIPKKVLFIYSDILEKWIKKIMKVTRYTKGIGESGAYKPYNLMTDDKKMLIVKLPAGAPFTAMTIDEAIAIGGKEFLILGPAGGIKKGIEVSDIVLCNKAVRDEGVSHHYIKPSEYAFADKSLVSKLEGSLRRSKIDFYKGASWTTDAIYMETKEELDHFRNKGVITVEMEASALFAVAQRRKVKAAAIFTISDVLGQEWSGIVDRERRFSGYRKLAQIAKLFKNA